MLIIHSINPTGAFSYGESDTIDLYSRGVVHLKGKNEDEIGSNGSGKSSLFNTLCVLLFGKNPTGVKDKEVPNSLWDSGMCARCEFTSWENVRYRITYARDWKSEFYPRDNSNELSYVGTRLFFDRLEGSIWQDQTGSSMKETREFIDYAVGVTYENFLSMSYMSLRVGSRFLQGTNQDRMDVLAGITGVNEWDKALEKARLCKRQVNNTIQGVMRNISYEKGAKETMESDYRKLISMDFSSTLESLNKDLNQLRSDYASEKAKLDAVQGEIDKLLEDRDNSYSSEKLEDIKAKIREANQEISDKTAKIYSMDFRVDVSDELYQDLVRSKEEYSSLKAEYGLYTSNGSTSLLDMKDCPTCGSKITKTKKDSIQKKVEDLESKIKAAKKSYEDLDKAWEVKVEASRKLFEAEKEKIKEECNKLRIVANKYQEEINGELNTYNEINNVIAGKTSILQDFHNKLSEIKRKGDQKKYEISSINSQLDRIKELEGSIGKKEEVIKEYEDQVKAYEDDLKVYDWYISNVPYIKLHKLSVSMSELSDMVNKYLIDMGDPIRVNISSFDEKAKKKNAADIKDMLKSEIKVEVTSGEKNISTRLYSDGELSKLSNAFIRGLHDLARKFGYGCNLLMLDEVFSFIDSDNSQKLADSFRNSLDYGTTLVTDNSGIVDNLLTFDEVWVARKKNGKTKLEIQEV